MIRHAANALLCAGLLAACAGCLSAASHRQQADRAAQRAIESTQQHALGKIEPIEVATAADTLRRRLLLSEKLPHRGPVSLGVRDLPDSGTWTATQHLDPAPPAADMNTRALLSLSLLDALQVSARNSREYRDAKESLFKAALNLDLEANDFRTTFAGALSAEFERDGTGGRRVETTEDGEETVTEESAESVLQTGTLGMTRQFLNGVELSSSIVVDLVKLLTQDAASALGLSADASIAIPLLRGAGRTVASEPLRQAEQDLLYEVYASKEAVAAHKETPHYNKWRETVADWMAKPRAGRMHKIICPEETTMW